MPPAYSKSVIWSRSSSDFLLLTLSFFGPPSVAKKRSRPLPPSSVSLSLSVSVERPKAKPPFKPPPAAPIR